MIKWGDIITKNGRKEKYFPLHSGQTEVLQASQRFIAAIAGSGGGKTACGALWLMQEIQKNPTGKFLIVTPTFKILRSATLPTWKLTVEGTDLEGEHKVADSEYELPTGARIYLRSAEEPRSMQGIVANAAWVDEGGLISKEAWDTVLQRVGYKKGRVLVTTTPYSFNFLFRDFYQRAKTGDKNYFVRQFPSTLNPTYPIEEYERARATLPRHKFSMLYEGEFMKAAGLVYPEMDSCIVPVPSALPDGRLVGGMDFGFNDPFCAIAGLVDNDDCLWLFYERYMRGETLDVHSKYLPKSVLWYCDSSRPDSIKDLKRMGHYVRPCRKGSGSIQHGLLLVHERIRERKLKIVKGSCPALLQEAEEYHYPSVDEESHGDLPASEQDDHACDALRYLVSMIDRKKRRE